MTDGVPPNSASLSRAFPARVHKRTATPTPPQTETNGTDPKTPRTEAGSAADEALGIREYNLLHLGLRRLAQILPQIDRVTTPLE